MQQTDMSNLIGIPSADYYETRLTNMRNGTNGTVYVENVPDGSMPDSEYSYIVVNPGEVNMQVAKIDGRDSENKTFNVVDVAIPKGAGTYYNATNHPLGSIVRFSNNYAFWKDIQEAINGKLDITSLAPVAVSNDYNDLDNKLGAGENISIDEDNKINVIGGIPNNPTITIQKNGDKVDDFTLNQASDKSIDIPVPTKTSDITNDNGFTAEVVITSHDYEELGPSTESDDKIYLIFAQ